MDILVIGQSNASNWFHDISFSAPHADALSWRSGGWNSVRGEGAVAFSATLAAASGEEVRLLNAAEGNTSLTPVQSANWLATGPGSLYAKMLSAVAASGLKPDAIIWIQGERDAQFGVSEQAYRDGLETLFDRLATQFGEVPVFLQPLILPQTGMGPIVAAQEDFVASHAHATLLAPQVELLTRDYLHFTPAGYNVLGDLMAREVLAALGLPAPDPIAYGTSAGGAIAGSGAAERIYAGAGNDRIGAAGGADVLLGEQGNDRLLAGGGNDVLSGGSGNDTLGGGSGSDLLVGDTGADRFMFAEAPGADHITDFAPGVDRLVFDPMRYALERLTYSGGSVYYEADGSGPAGRELVVTLQGAPALTSADIAAATSGTSGADRIAGGAGSDSLNGGDGDDTLLGSSGDDLLTGGAGADSLDGGLGHDTYFASAGDRIVDAGGTDHVRSDVSWTLREGFEHLTLTGTADISAVGNGLGNCLAGNAGSNRLEGREGNDTLIGAGGSDAFDFRNVPRAADADRIADFAPGVDRIRLDDAAHPGIGATGNFSASDVRFWAAAGAVHGHDADDRVVYDVSSGNLYYDPDGSGGATAVLIATLEGAPAIGAADFAVV